MSTTPPSHPKAQDKAQPEPEPQPQSKPRASSSHAGGGSSSPNPPTAPLRVAMDDAQIRRALRRIAHELIESREADEKLYLVAIPNGGVPLARQLAANLHEIGGIEVRMGILDTTLYRDDLLSGRTGRPSIQRTEMPAPVDGYVAVLVDDVISTGRTIRAAMDALMDFGRPNSVRLAVLVDRGHRELPIRIDFVGKNMPTQSGESLELRADGTGEASSLELVVVAAPPTEVPS